MVINQINQIKELEDSELNLKIEGQHNSLILKDGKGKTVNIVNDHPDSQWFRNAGLGLFLHWGISAVDGTVDISWGMLDRGVHKRKELSREEIEKLVVENNFSPTEKRLKPAHYFKLAEEFKAEKYDPDKWMRAAKKAGFRYAVLTTQHCDGFALWPTDFGEFSTKNYLGGRDLVREYVDACRKYEIKVGFYYTPTNWYFNRKHMSFLHYLTKRKNPDLQELDMNLEPVVLPDEEEMALQNKKVGVVARGQLEELLTRYGKIDLLWTDGAFPTGETYPMRRIRELQPGIVVNGRMHGYGDFRNIEYKFIDQKPEGWWEYCTIWSERPAWAYTRDSKYRPVSAIVTELVSTRRWGGNYLINIGPMADGEFPEDANQGLEDLAAWTTVNGESVFDTTVLLDGEKSNIPATAKEGIRYLFVLPGYFGVIELSGAGSPVSVKWLADDSNVEYVYDEGTLRIVPQNIKTCDNVSVIKVIL